jgi:hypothetical protein
MRGRCGDHRVCYRRIDPDHSPGRGGPGNAGQPSRATVPIQRGKIRLLEKYIIGLADQ